MNGTIYEETVYEVKYKHKSLLYNKWMSYEDLLKELDGDDTMIN